MHYPCSLQKTIHFNVRAIAGDFRRCPHDWFPQCVGKRCPVATCDENFRTFAKVTSADLRGWESVIPPQPATKEHQTYTAGPPTPPSSPLARPLPLRRVVGSFQFPWHLPECA